jgi:hypothetical protein
MKLRLIAAMLLCGFGASAQLRLTFGVVRPPNTPFNQTNLDEWLLRSVTTGPGNPDSYLLYGAAGDIPVIGDWYNTGINNVGVFRSAYTPLNPGPSPQWILSYPQNPPDISFFYGAPGDIPVVGDWTGSGKTTVGVFRPANMPSNTCTTSGQWLLRNSNTPGNPDIVFCYGAPGDMPVVGDWTGSGNTTIGVFRPANSRFNKTTSGEWLLRDSNTAGNPTISFFYGAPGDIPVVGDWMKTSYATTVGVFRPANQPFNTCTTSGEWLLRNSNTPGNPDIVFCYGAPGDIPVVGIKLEQTPLH